MLRGLELAHAELRFRGVVSWQPGVRHVGHPLRRPLRRLRQLRAHEPRGRGAVGRDLVVAAEPVRHLVT